MKDQLIVRKAVLSDLADLKRIGIKTFHDTFSESNTKEDMAIYLEETFNESILTKELADVRSQYYLAFNNADAVGYLKINFDDAQTDIKDKEAIEIERLYVLKEYLGKSVGRLLFNKAIGVAKERKSKFLWLGVWEKNPRAIAFYKKNGMIEFDTHPFRLGNDLQTDILMKVEFQ